METLKENLLKDCLQLGLPVSQSYEMDTPVLGMSSTRVCPEQEVPEEKHRSC